MWTVDNLPDPAAGSLPHTLPVGVHAGSKSREPHLVDACEAFGAWNGQGDK